jgi:hypothetical protein
MPQQHNLLLTGPYLTHRVASFIDESPRKT